MTPYSFVFPALVKQDQGITIICSINSRIADLPPLLEHQLRLPPTMTERAKVPELALVDHKSLWVKECLHVYHSPNGESDQAGVRKYHRRESKYRVTCAV